jgi:N-acetylglucosaminyldiphosphoundecaprenol N-acetyl-beta-D-mannosaminyltransferase
MTATSSHPAAPFFEGQRIDVVGVLVDPLTTQDIVDTVEEWTESDSVHVAVGINAHACNLAATDEQLRGYYRAADLAYADGQSIVWAAKVLGRFIPERVATTDLIQPLATMCALKHKKLFFFGGRPGVADKAAATLRQNRPELEIETQDGYVSAADMDGLINRINESHSDVLLVGQGDPLQQQWIAAHRHELRVPAVLTCGGLFDWISGDNRRAPSWMISGGLEWLWRLMIEPRRLAKRYIVGNPAFLARLSGSLVVRAARRIA